MRAAPQTFTILSPRFPKGSQRRSASAARASPAASGREALSRARGSVTVIIIAHRLATVLGADRIIALDGGRIVEEGSPEELKRNPDSYLFKMLAISNA